MQNLETEESRLWYAAAAVVNAVYGAPQRIAALSAHLVDHWENRRARMGKFIEAPGKAMIVGGTWEICANLYTAIVELRPDWHSGDLAKGKIKVVYSGDATDAPPVAEHVRRDSLNATVKKRLKDVDDELELVIVKDMMLTGYDSPPLHTLYLDRPFKGALLMQTLARVNRTFRGKEDGLLVAYAPLADNLAKALSEYTQTDRANKPVGKNIDEAVGLAVSLVASLRRLLADYDWKSVLMKGGPKAFLNAVTGAVSYLRNPGTPGNQHADGEESLAAAYRRLSSQLSRAWALCAGSETLAELRPEIQVYEEIRVWMAKYDAADRQASGEPVPEDTQRLLGDLITSATSSGEVLDIYDAAGMPKPSLDDLTPEFIAKTQQARNPQLAIEALRKLIADESAASTRNNVIRQRAFSERITELMKKYTNQQLTSAEVIAELVELARELVSVMRRDVRTDWTVRDDVRAKLRSSIKRLLVRFGYPPDKQPEAIKLVMEQMESMAPRFAEARP